MELFQMRKVGIVFFLVMLGFVELGYTQETQPEYRSMSERIGERRTRQMMRNLAPDTKLISFDDYVNRKLTRGERREARKEKKKGIYKSPVDEFKLMDKNEDGFLSPDEMNKYYVEKARVRYE